MTTSEKSGGAVERKLLDAIEASDVAEALKLVKEMMDQGIDPWKIHLSLSFPRYSECKIRLLSTPIYRRCTASIGISYPM